MAVSKKNAAQTAPILESLILLTSHLFAVEQNSEDS